MMTRRSTRQTRRAAASASASSSSSTSKASASGKRSARGSAPTSTKSSTKRSKTTKGGGGGAGAAARTVTPLDQHSDDGDAAVIDDASNHFVDRVHLMDSDTAHFSSSFASSASVSAEADDACRSWQQQDVGPAPYDGSLSAAKKKRKKNAARPQAQADGAGGPRRSARLRNVARTSSSSSSLTTSTPIPSSSSSPSPSVSSSSASSSLEASRPPNAQKSSFTWHYNPYHRPRTVPPRPLHLHPLRRSYADPMAPNLLSDLPTSVLSHSLFDGYLDTVCVVKTLSAVSKGLGEVARTSVTRLDLRNMKSMTPDDAGRLATRFPNLAELDLSYCDQFGNDHVLRLCPLASTLRVLRLRGTGISALSSTDGEVLHNLPLYRLLSLCHSLEELDLSATSKEGSGRIGRFAVEALSKHCPNLRKLHLGWCTRVTDKTIDILASSLTRLEEIDVSLCPITDDACLSLSRISSLRRLDLGATRISERGVRILVTGRADPLALEASNSVFVLQREGLSGMTSQRARGTHPCGLDKLNISFVQGITVEMLEVLALHAPSLAELNMMYCNIDASTDMKAVLRHMRERGTIVVTSNAP